MSHVLNQADRLIADYLEPDRWRPGEANYRLKRRGIAVWALIGRYRLTPGEDAAAVVADAYGISVEEMRAVLAYYARHQAAVDARLAALAAD